jgi:hypothetical protein
VVGHAAAPGHEDFERVREVVRGLVEQHFAQAATDHHAEHAVEQHVVQVFVLPSLRGDVGLGLDAHPAQDHEQGKGEHIHDPVPVDVDGADAEGDRIRLRVYEHIR